MEEAVEVLELEDINALYSQIRRDPNFLENIDRIPFVDTPLHAAARNGNIDLVIEITRLKPSFARKLNPDGFSPVHIALQNGQTQTVLRLLDTDPELVRVKGREGITPLHYASEKGDIYLLVRFLSVCPKSIEDVTNQGETALHVALKNDKVEAFEVITRQPPWPGSEKSQYCNKRIFNWKDKEGNTLLHIATSRNQLQVVSCLVDRQVDVKNRNLDGWTPLDMLLDQPEPRNEEIENMLRNAEARLPTLLPTFDTDTHLRTDQRLNLAARVGNVDAIYDLLLEDVHLLDRIDQVPFIDTPLHIAASAGHVQFALEITRLKPSFARKQNQYGFSPLLLALKYEQTQMVLRFLDVDRNLVRVQGREGKTSLHYAAEKGIVDLLSEFLAACPESIKDVTIRKETALHIAVKNNKLEVLEILLGWLQYVGKQEILKCTDDKGDTLLHTAISRGHIQMVRLIVKDCPKIYKISDGVEINARNLAGLTVLGILEDQLQRRPEYEELKHMLRKAGARKQSSRPNPVVNMKDFLRKKVPWFRKIRLSLYRSSLRITNENREAVLVVAVLIATATYQAALTPSQVLEGTNHSVHFRATNMTTTATNVTNGEESGTQNYSWDVSTTMKTVLADLFLIFNASAFLISTLVIERNLPEGTAFRLVCPLLFCFIILMAARSPSTMLCTTIGYWIVRIVERASRLGNNRISKFSTSVLKHYRSFCDEMAATL